MMKFMRTKGAYEYGDKATEIIFNFVGVGPQTTYRIRNRLISDNVFAKIHVNTVRRLLETLWKEGKIKKQEIGEMTVWLK